MYNIYIVHIYIYIAKQKKKLILSLIDTIVNVEWLHFVCACVLMSKQTIKKKSLSFDRSRIEKAWEQKVFES